MQNVIIAAVAALALLAVNPAARAQTVKPRLCRRLKLSPPPMN